MEDSSRCFNRLPSSRSDISVMGWSSVCGGRGAVEVELCGGGGCVVSKGGGRGGREELSNSSNTSSLATAWFPIKGDEEISTLDKNLYL